ncbi:MAG: hypothetical protein R3B93_19130 [Bacteroidia bacterium]
MKRYYSIHILYLLLGIMILPAFLWAHEDHYYNSLVGDQVQVNRHLIVQEGYYIFQSGNIALYQLGYLYNVGSSYGLVRLRYDYESAEVFSQGGSSDLTVVCDIKWHDISGISHVESGVTLTVDPTNSEIQSTIRIEGAHQMDIKITNISGGLSGALQPGVHLFLEGEIMVERYFRINGPTPPDPSQYNLSLSLPGVSLATLNWSGVMGAEYYELEWLALDDAQGAVSSNLSAHVADFSQAARVQVRERKYELSLLYPAVVFVYRIRPVFLSGPDGVGIVHYGPWSTDAITTTGNEDEVPLGQSLTGNDYYLVYSGFEMDRNWQSSRVFAEWGMQKEGVQFADGIGQLRQSLFRLNTEGNVVVSEGIYDYQGRMAAQILPHPVTGTELQFYEGLHLNSSGDVFSVADFDEEDQNGNPYHQVPMKTTAGAAEYYSSNNPFLQTGTNDPLRAQRYGDHYIPNAGGYVYSRTMFMDDATGRVRMQSGVGTTHRIQDPEVSYEHQTQYFYTGTNKGELYRLFGKEVGDPSHYTKEMVLDPNGQLSISYKDMHGRVIATALAGLSPTNLEAIPRPPAEVVTTPLPLSLPKDKSVDVYSSTSSFPVSTYPAPLYTFEYELLGADYFNDCAEFCSSCAYRVRFELINPEGEPAGMDVQQPSGPNVSFLTNPAPVPGTPVTSFEVLYEPAVALPANASCGDIANLAGNLTKIKFYVSPTKLGNYTIIRTIEIDQTNYQAAKDHFDLTHDYCGATYSSGIDSLDCEQGCLFAAYLALASPPSSATYADAIAWYTAHTNPTQIHTWMETNCLDPNDPQASSPGPAITMNPTLDECEADCENLLIGLKADVDLGGQYYLDDAFLADVLLSISTFGNPLPTITITSSTSPSDFRQAFAALSTSDQSDWVDELVTYHPEHCHYEICSEPDMLASCRFDRWLRYEITDAGGSLSYNDPNLQYPSGGNDINLLDPHSTLSDAINQVDPYFSSAAGSTYHAAFISSLVNYPTGNAGQSPDNIIVSAEDAISSGQSDGAINTFDEWKMVRDMYISLKQSYITSYIATYSCISSHYQASYLQPIGNTPSYADGKLIHVMDPTIGMSAGFGGSIPGTGQSDPDYLCAQVCSVYAGIWTDLLNNCIDVDPNDGQVIYTISGHQYSFDEHQTTYLNSATGLNQSIIEWIVLGGTYSGTTIDGLKTLCEQNCETNQDFSGCLPAGALETVLDDVFSTLMGEDLSDPSPVSGSTWMDLLTQCLNIPVCSDLPFNCPCEVFDINDSRYGPDHDLQAFLDYHGMTNPPFGQSANIGLSDILAWKAACEAVPTTLYQNDLPIELRCYDVGIVIDNPDPCGAFLSAVYATNIQVQQNATYQEALAEFETGYKESCWGVNENLVMSYELDEYHYTLYYYDQSGSLVQTVPPEGVDVLTGMTEQKIADIDQWKETGTPPTTGLEPVHELKTRYNMDSYGKIVGSRVPDEDGARSYFYDDLGRERFSQNARQVINGTYSYSRYDNLSRVIEVGELEPAVGSDPTLAANLNNAVGYPALGHGDRHDITQTHYGTNEPRLLVIGSFGIAGFLSTVPVGMMNNDRLRLRNRIGAVLRIEEIPSNLTYTIVEYGTHYEYDISGNARKIVQADHSLIPFGNDHAYKEMAYEFELISGKVNEFRYQEGKVDQYYHRYRYDADNRLTHTFTSQEGVIWDQDASYQYALHGPLSRTELGEDLIQGQDYYYTLQGWIKGVNNPALSQAFDPGRDGSVNSGSPVANLNENFAPDVMSYQLDYFTGDYSAIGSGETYWKDPLISSGSDYATNKVDLYNGNINAMVTGLTLPNPNNPSVFTTQLQAMAYRYDQLNRITRARAYDNYDIGMQTWSANAGAHINYQARYKYDGNGNLTYLFRNGNLTTTNPKITNFENDLVDMDALSYEYDPGADGSNKLLRVVDNIGATNYTNDIDHQSSNNYAYDEIGQLTSDNEGNIQSITWDVYNKITEIEFASVASGDPARMRFAYDGMGNRIRKEVDRDQTGETDFYTTITYYVRDGSGNIISTYEMDHYTGYNQGGAGALFREFKQKEINLYGSSRLGMDKVERSLQKWETTVPGTIAFYSIYKAQEQIGDVTTHQRILGKKNYELSNHLGNVLATVSDKKIVNLDAGGGIPFVISGYTADLLFASDYYPFGMQMPGRTYNAGGYRFGFQGQETDDEIYGTGNAVSYKYRVHDARIGRFLSIDPLAPEYSWNSPYAFSENRVIDGVELEGLEYRNSTKEEIDSYKRIGNQVGEGAPQVGDGIYGHVYQIGNGDDAQYYTWVGKHYSQNRFTGEVVEGKPRLSMWGGEGVFKQLTFGTKAFAEGENLKILDEKGKTQTIKPNDYGMVRFPESGPGFGRYTNANGGSDGNNENYLVDGVRHTGDNYASLETAVDFYNVIQEFTNSKIGKGITIHYGDISAFNPAINLGHSTHFTGESIDIHYFKNDGTELRWDIAYSRAGIRATNAFFKVAEKYDFINNYSYGRRFKHRGMERGRNNHELHKNHFHIGQ